MVKKWKATGGSGRYVFDVDVDAEVNDDDVCTGVARSTTPPSSLSSASNGTGSLELLIFYVNQHQNLIPKPFINITITRKITIALSLLDA